MYKINDKVIFHVGFMKAPAVGYIEQINGTHVHCRFSVPLMGRTHQNVRIDQLKPSQELIDQREKDRQGVIIDIQPTGRKKTIQEMVEELTYAKKVRIQKRNKK